MKRTRLKPISDRKRKQLKEELPERIFICERAGGEWIPVKSSMVGGYCKGGFCEYCGKPASHSGNWIRGFRLEPHEENHRGLGGRLTRDNSKMSCAVCHPEKQIVRTKREKVIRIED